jgi:ferric-dicitrate binding protein FerR (iron transport regulator)
MEEKTPWSIISRYFDKQATPEEMENLEKWLGEDSVNRRMFSELSELHQLTESLPQPLLPDKQKAWKKIERRIKMKNNPSGLFLRRLSWSAAAVALLLVGMAIHLLVDQSAKSKLLGTQFTEIVTSPGQKSRVILPDGSSVWLNSGSSLRYSGEFNLKEREVIVEGEAFFEVTKDKDKEFRVRTGTLDVVVYGTSFNVKNFRDDNFQEITVAEGCVGLWNNIREIRQLHHGDQALLDKSTNKIAFRKGDAGMVSAWKNNELVFDNTPIEEVVRYLERWYGVTITIDEAMKKKHNYTFKVKTESFREMLELMKIITPLTYEISGKDVKIRYSK